MKERLKDFGTGLAIMAVIGLLFLAVGIAIMLAVSVFKDFYAGDIDVLTKYVEYLLFSVFLIPSFLLFTVYDLGRKWRENNKKKEEAEKDCDYCNPGQACHCPNGGIKLGETIK